MRSRTGFKIWWELRLIRIQVSDGRLGSRDAACQKIARLNFSQCHTVERINTAQSRTREQLAAAFSSVMDNLPAARRHRRLPDSEH